LCQCWFIFCGVVLGIIVGPVDVVCWAISDLVDDFSARDFFEAMEDLAQISRAAAGAFLGVEGGGVEMNRRVGPGAAAGEGMKLPVAAGEDHVALGGFFLEDQIAVGHGA